MYSRKRLAAIAFLWLGLAVVALALNPFPGAVADPRGCDTPPCAFPAENNIGGIVLATDSLQGQNLKSFGVGDTPGYTDRTPPGRVDPVEQNIGLGISDVDSTNFIIYKQWYYFDQRTGSPAPVYVWQNATRVQLTAADGNVNCGNTNEGWQGSTSCDFLANVSEVSNKVLEAQTDCQGGFLLPDIACGIVPDTLTVNNIWAVRPEDDTCGVFGALGGIVCLGLIKDGGESAFGATVTTDSVTAYDIQIRGHVFKSVYGADTTNKELVLTNPYLEMRYGYGRDRFYTPSSNNGRTSNPNWAQPFTSPEGFDSALGADFLCQGSGPQSFCSIPEGRAQNREGESYDNVHLPR